MDHAVPEVLIHFNISCSSDVLAKKKEIVFVFFLLSIFCMRIRLNLRSVMFSQRCGASSDILVETMLI